MSLTLENLLARGYFPQELPPPFSSQALAKFVAAEKSKGFPFVSKPATSIPEVFNLARTGTLRRQLSILNPIHFSLLADFVVDNWVALEKEATGSVFSLSSPVATDSKRGIGRKHKMDQRPDRRAQVYAQGRYLLRADISRFYPSVYTHCIPWALHGKEYSKQHKFDPILGNQLDKLVQNCQYGQTNGIPIGPDTSLLIAETLLCRVDAELAKLNITGLRYVDDFELVFNSQAEALEGLSVWMLAYEAAVQGWLVSPSGTDFVGNDVNFSRLKVAGVNFYDTTKTALPPPPPKVKISPALDYSLLDDSEDDEAEEEESFDYF